MKRIIRFCPRGRKSDFVQDVKNRFKYDAGIFNKALSKPFRRTF